MSAVVLEQIDRRDAEPTLGRECRFALRGERTVVPVEYFLEHEGILYSEPLRAEPDGSVRLFPEVPGRYILNAGWRSPTESGWVRASFSINGPRNPGPHRVRAHGQKLWTPTAWDAHLLGDHEQALLRALHELVRRDATVYDIGANVGVFAVWFARWLRNGGWLYAIEPSPVCVSFLRANLAAANTNNFTILPVAVSSHADTVDFTLNYGNSFLGSVMAASPSIVKPGHHVGVTTESLDQLIAKLGLRAPDVIKMDIEGAEAHAVTGMLRTIESHRPILMIELHGVEAGMATLDILIRFGYRITRPPLTTREVPLSELTAALHTERIQIVGIP